MLKVKVHATTVSGDSHKDLVERLEGIIEALRNRGDQILAVMPNPMPCRLPLPPSVPQTWTATVFHEHDLTEF